MANIGHDHVNSVGENYDATSEAPVAGWVKAEHLVPSNQDAETSNPKGQSATDGGWKQC